MERTEGNAGFVRVVCKDGLSLYERPVGGRAAHDTFVSVGAWDEAGTILVASWRRGVGRRGIAANPGCGFVGEDWVFIHVRGKFAVVGCEHVPARLCEEVLDEGESAHASDWVFN